MLDDYLERIGFGGPARPDFETLDRLQQFHLAAIPFEAIDVLAGKPVDPTLPAVFDKLVTARRGGYCFEQNRLFEAMLGTIGFDVQRVLARVLAHLPDGAPRPPRTHLALIVRLDGAQWLADVGFGGSVPDQPLRLVPDIVQQTRHDSFRFLLGAEGLVLTMFRDGSWMPGYELTPGMVEDSDIETANWLTATHPGSGFRKALSVSLCTPKARYGLYGRQLSIRPPFEPARSRPLEEAELGEVLHRHFKLPEGVLANRPNLP